jgi:phage head maturation protease
MRISSTQLKAAVKTGKRLKGAVIQKSYFEQPKIEEDRTATFVFSSNASDREDDVISPDGIDFKNFMKNPVILFAHNQSLFPIAKCISLAVVGNKLIGKIKFHPADMPISGPFAEEAYRQLSLGVMGVSMGFCPVEYDLNSAGGVDYTKIELLETSVVSVPCNPEALLMDLSKSEDEDDEDKKDDDEEETESVDEDEEDTKTIEPVKTKNIHHEALKFYFEYLV